MQRVRLGVCLLCVLWGCATASAATPENVDVRLGEDKVQRQALERLRGASNAPKALGQHAEAAAAAATLAAERGGQVWVTSAELGLPEVVGPARGRQTLGRIGTLRSEAAARAFVERYAALYGLTVAEAQALVTDAVYTNPAGNLEWVRLQQRVNGLPVFRGELTVALRPDGEIVRTTGQLAGGIAAEAVAATPVLSPVAAADHAAAGLAPGFVPSDLGVVERAADGSHALLRSPRRGIETRAELVVFPLGNGAATLAWSMVLWGQDQAYYGVVSAQDGTLLFRKSIKDHVAFSYRVYPSDSPTPTTPGPLDPALGTQGATQASTLVSVEHQIVGGSSVDAWLPPGATVTDGNNVEAGPDRIAPDGVDAPVNATAPGVFDYAANPPPGLPPPGNDPLVVTQQNAATVNAFYWANRFHDLTYNLGFTEPARNLQHDNHGRGGLGNDRLAIEIQDSSGTNNANSLWPPDGSRGRMQSYIWTGDTPDRDGAFDASVILHELTHGLAQRLHSNSAGLATAAAGSLTEGWGDFYALALLSEPSDPVEGVYAVGGYATYLLQPGFTGNHYYGIRRFPLAPLSATGGPLDRPHNPMTFADVDPAQINLGDGAYARGPIGLPNPSTHGNGEVWASMLWEARARLIGTHGATAGNQRMLQYVTDGMKLDPVAPTFLSARDAILAAACAQGGQDEAGLWDGFAARGLGVDARFISGETTVTPTVVESFLTPSDALLAVDGSSSASCPVPGRIYGPGETVRLALTFTNASCGTTVTGITATASGGGSVAVASLAPGASAERTLDVVLPGDAACGSTFDITVQVQSSAGSSDLVYSVPVGEVQSDTVAFTNDAAINLPSGQPGTTVGPAAPYPSNIVVSGVTDPIETVRVTLHGLTHTYPGDLDALLVSPSGHAMVLMSDAFDTNDAAGVTFDIRDDAADAMPSLGAVSFGPAYRPTDHGASADAFVAPAPPSPYARPAPGGAATLTDFAATDANPNGVWSLYLVDDASGDVGSLAGGWTLTLVTSNGTVCPACNLVVFEDGFED